MKSYHKSKESEIKSIENIPECWETIRLKFMLSSLESGNRESKSIEIEDGAYSIGGEHINWNANIDLSNPRFISKEYYDCLKSGKVKTNDVLLVKDGATIGKCAIIKKDFDKPCAVNEHVFILRGQKNVDPDFLFYLIFSNIGQEQIKLCIRGSAQPGLNSSFVNNTLLPFPPLKEQRKIAKFLNIKTSKINNLVKKKQRMIELLKEQREVVISNSVTKGLDKTAELKDSGVDWIGEIPKHWEMRRLASIGTFSKGKGISRSDLKEEGHPAILYGDIYTKYDIQVKKMINRISEETTSRSVPICDGAVLLAGSGETLEDIGRTIAYIGKETAYAGGDVIIFNQKEQNSQFLSYALNSNCAKHQKILTGRGDTIIHTYSSKLKNIIIPLPPLGEQKEIARYLDNKISKIDKSLKKIHKELRFLYEFREAVISEAISGKIEIGRSRGRIT